MLRYEQLENILFENIKIESSELFNLARELAQKAEPNLCFGENDRRWIFFYLPVSISRYMPPAEKFALIPFALIWQKHSFHCEIYYLVFPYPLSSIEVVKGNRRVSKMYRRILEDTIDFLPNIKANPQLIEKHVPYIFRRGRIKRKYVEEPELSREYAAKLLRLYESRNRSEIYPISLKDYLKTAGCCIRAVYPEESSLSDYELYERHSDFRRAGILELDPENPEEFTRWYESRAWWGSHPFEIIAGVLTIGIVLFPPDKETRRYRLIVGEPFHAYALAYVKCVEALIESNIPFDALQLEKVLDYLTGEAYLPVNEDPWSVKCDGSEEYAKYVEWETLKIPKLK